MDMNKHYNSLLSTLIFLEKCIVIKRGLAGSSFAFILNLLGSLPSFYKSIIPSPSKPCGSRKMEEIYWTEESHVLEISRTSVLGEASVC